MIEFGSRRIGKSVPGSVGMKIVFLWAFIAPLALGMISITRAEAKNDSPIKVGFIAPQTGNFAQMGKDMIDGFTLYLKENNYEASGRKIELIVEDEGANPNIAVAKARKLIYHDKVHFIAGMFLTPAAYAVAPICVKENVPLVITLSAGDDLTQRSRANNVIRLAFTGCQLGHVAGDYAYKTLGWRNTAIISWDHGYGHETSGGFQQTFESAGGRVTQKVWVPLTTMDFNPFVTNLKRDFDGVFEVITGSASIRFLKAMREAGLSKPGKIIAAGTATDESLLPALTENGLGVLSVDIYSAMLTNPASVKFRQKVLTELGREPNVNIECNYTGAKWIIQAIELVKGNVENTNEFMAALRKIEIPDSVRGPLKLDQYGHAVQNVYIRRVDNVGGAYQNTVIETYPKVSQFWNFDPQKYLDSPVYSRTFPPCKYCK